MSTHCLFLSVLVIYVCSKREKTLNLKTCAPDFSATPPRKGILNTCDTILYMYNLVVMVLVS